MEFSRRWQYGWVVILITLTLVYVFSFSTPSFWSVNGKLRPVGDSTYLYDQVSEVNLPDGTLRYDRRRFMSPTTSKNLLRDSVPMSPETLFLVLTKDSSSWSQENATSPPRTVDSMLQLLQSTEMDLSMLSLAIMTAAADEYATIISATERYPFARVTVILREPDKHLSTISGTNRHAGEVQAIRRAGLARLRNYLMTTALEREKHIFWLDADVTRFSERIVQTMIEHAETNATAGIITALCTTSSTGHYDMNAFRTNNPEWVEHAVPEEKFDAANLDYLRHRIGVDALIQSTADDALVSLTSVGGTLLYIRAGLVRYGLMFPWWNVIGTTWLSEGWMGRETEGLCWAAQFLEGGGCYVLGGRHRIAHAG